MLTDAHHPLFPSAMTTAVSLINLVAGLPSVPGYELPRPIERELRVLFTEGPVFFFMVHLDPNFKTPLEIALENGLFVRKSPEGE